MRVPLHFTNGWDYLGLIDEYQNVYLLRNKMSKREIWKAAKILRVGFRIRRLNAYYDNPREAAKAVDIFLIRYNHDPVNILKPCKKTPPE